VDNPSGPGVWERRAPYFFVGPSFLGLAARMLGRGHRFPVRVAREHDRPAHPTARRGERPRVLVNLLGSQNANCR